MVLTYLLTTGVAFVALRTTFEQWKSWMLSQKNWDDLVAELQPIHIAEIMAIALEYLNPDQLAVTSDPKERLNSLGGREGLRRMRANGELLIALAAQAERWNSEITRTLVAQMRDDGAELRKVARWMTLPFLDAGARNDQAGVRRAAAAYYRMSYRLLDAVRESSPSYLSSLNAAVWN